ncbi:MAG: ABC transporter permease, partial [Mesorhizobium sp.]
MFRLEARTSTPAWFNLALPLLAIAATLVLCSGLIAIAGAGVIEAYGVMLSASLGDSYAITETLVRAAPMIFTGLAVAIAFRAKFWNIGAEGQLIFGAIFGSIIPVLFPHFEGPLVLPLMLILGMFGGAVYAAIPALLKTRFSTNEILTSLMLVYVAQLFLD